MALLWDWFFVKDDRPYRKDALTVLKTNLKTLYEYESGIVVFPSKKLR